MKSRKNNILKVYIYDFYQSIYHFKILFYLGGEKLEAQDQNNERARERQNKNVSVDCHIVTWR